jgi:hypothetical protein
MRRRPKRSLLAEAMETDQRHRESQHSDAPEIRSRMAGTNKLVFVWCLVGAAIVVAVIFALCLVLGG